MRTMTLWHGGRGLEYSFREVVPQRLGNWEHGPGLYLTSHYSTAARYAKGGGKTYLVTFHEGNDVGDVTADWSLLASWVKSNCLVRHREDIADDLRDHASRIGSDEIGVEVLINLCLNYEALPGGRVGALRKFLIELGVDYGFSERYGGRDETLAIIIDPEVLMSVVAVPAKDVDPADYVLPVEWI